MTAPLDDPISTLKGVVQNLSQISLLLTQIFPRINGVFTLAAGASTVVPDTSITSTSVINWTPTNSAAALLLQTNGIYLSARTAGASFTITVQGGVAVGTETFQYFAFNPS